VSDVSTINELFVLDDDVATPTALTEGPWDATAMHGGPPAGLLARAAERFDAGDGVPRSEWFVSRLTIELLRPIPLRPLRIAARLVRPGKRLQLLEASLFAGDSEVARSVAMRVRRQRDFALPEVTRVANDAVDAARRPDFLDDPSLAPSAPSWRAGMGFFNRGADVRLGAGPLGVPGPGLLWTRLRVPLVAGEVDSPLVTTATLADFTNAASAAMPLGYAYPNADLTIARVRDSVGPWIGLASISRVSADGIGMIGATLYDTAGVIGQTSGTIVISSVHG
jgi:Thioesterase-like superfamily